MEISNFLDTDNYILYLKKDKNGVQHLQEAKKGLWTWIAVKVLKKQNYQLNSVVTYVAEQGQQILNPSFGLLVYNKIYC